MNSNDNSSSPQSPFSAGYNNAGVDIPPAPQAPHPVEQPVAPQTPINAPVEPVTTAPAPEPVAPTTTTQPTTPPPPPPTSVGTTPPSVVAPQSGGKIPKKPILIAVVLLFLALGGFSFIQFILPRLQGGLSNQQKTITWWGLWEEPATVQPLIDEYQSTHPNIVVKYEKVAKEQYRERLANAVAGDNGPDIMNIHNSWIPMFKSALSPMPSSVFSPQEYQQTFYSVMTADLSSGANIVAIPQGFDGLGLYVNDEIFSTYGKEVPKTWNDVRDAAIELTVRDEKGIVKQSGIAMGSTKNVDHWQEILALLILQNGAKLENPTGPLAEGALSFFTIFSKTDKVWDDTLPNSTTMFANGKLAMMIAPSWRAHEILEINPTLKFHVIAPPQLPKNSPEEPDLTYATYWANAVSAKSAHESESWEFLKFMSSKESTQKLYDNATKLRAFGQPYARVDMREQVSGDPKVGGFLSLAGNAKSWYLASRTFDGETGINSRIGKYFENAVNQVSGSSNDNPKNALATVAQGVLQVLVDYGLAAAPPPVKN